ncbi:MAG: type II secretion system F family protein [bacterium]
MTDSKSKVRIYNYVAYDEAGIKHAGLIEALSEKEAAKILKGGGYKNIKVKELTKWQHFIISNFVSLSKQEVMLFTRQVAEMLKVGFPIVRLFDVIALSTSNKKLALICLVIKENLKSGNAISSALQRYTKVFSPVYISLIKIGEKTGQLFDIVDQLAKYQEEEYRIRSKLVSSLVYPFFVLALTLLILWGLIVFVFPKLVEIMQGFEISMPFITMVLISISSFLSNPFVMTVGFSTLLSIALFFKLFTSISPGIKIFVEKILISIPYLGSILHRTYELRFATSLLLILKSGMSFLEGLRNLEQSFDSGIMKEVAITIQKYLKEGEYLSTALYKTKFFSSFFIDMIKTGEETGELVRMIEKMCYNLEFEIRSKISSLLSLFEPALIIFMGLAVGLIVLAVFLPVASIIGGVERM